VVDAGARAAWERDGRKLARLHAYWFYRAADAFMRSPQAAQTIGRPENHEANRLAYLCAIRTRLQLTEVYGVAETVTTDAGDVDTSIECDHQRFSGFLKVSLEEVLIALRDDRELLHDPGGPFGIAEGMDHAALYPDGFSCRRFVQVIDNRSVWDGIWRPSGAHLAQRPGDARRSSCIAVGRTSEVRCPASPRGACAHDLRG